MSKELPDMVVEPYSEDGAIEGDVRIWPFGQSERLGYIDVLQFHDGSIQIYDEVRYKPHGLASFKIYHTALSKAIEIAEELEKK